MVTDSACHALTVEGKVYNTFDFGGATLTAYCLNKNGIAVALETDRLHAAHRVVALDKKGKVRMDVSGDGTVRSLALSDDYLWLLTAESTSCLRLRNGECVFSEASIKGAFSIVALDDKTARVLSPAQALDLQLGR